MKPLQHWLMACRSIWVAMMSLFFLLNLDQFGFASGLGPPPKYWTVGAFLATLLLFLPGMKPLRLIRKPLFWWAFGYLLVSFVWIGPASDREAAVDGLMFTLTTCIVVGTALLAYPQLDGGGRLWGYTLWLALVLAVASIQYEYYDPTSYFFAEAGSGIVGRAAGFYLNPNIAAQGLVMILACLLLYSSRGASFLAVVVTLLGLFPTFSRGGLIAWVILVGVATWRGRLPRGLMILLLLGALTFWMAGDWLYNVLSAWVTPGNRNVLDRLAWLTGQGSLSDHAAGEREYMMAYGWNQFLEAPFLGHGLGSMWVWTARVGSHNMMLRFMYEFGLLGVLVFPLFLIASIRSAATMVSRRELWFIAGIIFLLSLFSHNMMEQSGFLLAWFAICLMPRTVTNQGEARRGAS